MNSEGVKSPMTDSCPARTATTRLCMLPSNSRRMFWPSTRAPSAAKPGAPAQTIRMSCARGVVFLGIGWLDSLALKLFWARHTVPGDNRLRRSYQIQLLDHGASGNNPNLAELA